MRISDWSSDVCSSDLLRMNSPRQLRSTPCPRRRLVTGDALAALSRSPTPWRSTTSRTMSPTWKWQHSRRVSRRADRKSVVKGKSVSVRVDLGGRRVIKKKIHRITTQKQKNEKY